MNTEDRPTAITKELSANDTGETGAHQAGIHIPKEGRILSFFPKLDVETKNPRVYLVFHDIDGTRWEFAFIYYNNLFYGGTRNEYRLTRMTGFIRQHGLRPGDSVVLCRDQDTGRLDITYQRVKVNLHSDYGILKLGSSWKEVKI